MEQIKIRNSLYIREQNGEEIHYYSIDHYGKNEVSPRMLLEEYILTGQEIIKLRFLNMPEVWQIARLYYKIV